MDAKIVTGRTTSTSKGAVVGSCPVIDDMYLALAHVSREEHQNILHLHQLKKLVFELPEAWLLYEHVRASRNSNDDDCMASSSSHFLFAFLILSRKQLCSASIHAQK